MENYEYDAAKKIRIVRLLNTSSHAEGLLEPDHYLSLLAKTQPVLLELVDLMRAVDKDHDEELLTLVAPPAFTPDFTTRRHSSIGYVSPIEFELKFRQHGMAA